MAVSHDSDTEDDNSETKTKTGSETEDDDSRKMSSSKRGREEEEKCNPGDSNEESKKLKKMTFHWSWTDECTILKNLYEFAGKNGSYSKDFYHFVKNKLTVEVSNSQLSDKVYRLRKRFLKDESKMEEGKMKFSNANYEKLFEMSKQIWGSSNSQNQSGDNILRSSDQWKPEVVNRFYGKMFKRVFEEIKVDITCIPPNILEDIRNDWEEMKTAQNEYELKTAKLLVEISDIRCSQNKS